MFGLNRHGADVARIGIIDGIRIMFAYRAEFAGRAPAGPQQLDTVTGTALGADAFSGFLTEADVLNAFDSLFGIGGTFFCLHLFSPEKSWG